MTTTTQSATNQTSSAASTRSLADRINSLLPQCRSRTDFYQHSFQQVAEVLGAVWGLLEIHQGARNISRELKNSNVDSTTFAEFALALSVETRMDNASRAKILSGEGTDFAAISCPLPQMDSNEPRGTVSMFLPVSDRDRAAAAMRNLELAVGHVVRTWENHNGTQNTAQQPAGETPELQALLNSSKYDTLKGLSYGLVNSFCRKLGCQKAALGIVAAQKIQLQAISGMDTLMENSPAIVDIRQSQEECLDANRTVVVQEGDGEHLASTDGLLIHRRWHKQTGASAVASIPIVVDDRTIAVFSLERHLSQPFEADELKKIEATVQTFGPAIEILQKSDRSLKQHLLDWSGGITARILKNRAAMIVACLAAAFFLFGWMPFNPTVPCTVQPAEISHLLAPFDGVIESAPMIPGDQVTEGQTVIRMDTRSLELERDSLVATIHSKEIERASALAVGDNVTASVVDAEINALTVQLKIARRKIDSGSLNAAYEGLVLRGDLRSQIGQVVAQGTSLAEIAPREGMTIQLQIPEDKAAYVTKGMKGKFAPESSPGTSYKFEITKVTHSTTVHDGRNVIMAEAIVEGDSEWMQSGMTGFANIRAQWKPVWWLVGHRLIDALRKGFWI